MAESGDHATRKKGVAPRWRGSAGKLYHKASKGWRTTCQELGSELRKTRITHTPTFDGGEHMVAGLVYRLQCTSACSRVPILQLTYRRRCESVERLHTFNVHTDICSLVAAFAPLAIGFFRARPGCSLSYPFFAAYPSTSSSYSRVSSLLCNAS